jgi:peptidoglycan/LPS O-acetylase OafA/YrhL
VPTLDLARLIAAACVVLFHFGFHGGVVGTHLDVYEPSLAAWARYGYLGVNVFFVISGFVIAWSAEGVSAADFAWRRWLRVYPTFIFCVAVTSSVILLARDPHFGITLPQLLAHVMVDPRRFRLPFVDGAYWTIVCELQFYGFVALGLSVPWLRRRATACIAGWYAFSLLNEYVIDSRMIRFALVTEWSCFFILGMMLYRLKRGRRDDAAKSLTRDAWNVGLAVLAFGTGLQLELRSAAGRFAIAPDYSPLVVALVLSSAIALLVLCARFRFRPRVELVLQRLGSISYPLYLLHGTIGYILINLVAPRAGFAAALCVAVTAGAALASLVAFVVEPWLKAWCSRWLLPVGPIIRSSGARVPLFALVTASVTRSAPAPEPNNVSQASEG